MQSSKPLWEPNPANERTYQTEEELESKTSNIRPVVANPRLACGHKSNAPDFPKGKCETCWGTYFMANPESTKTNVAAHRAGMDADIASVNGKKYLKMLTKFTEYLVLIAETVKKLEEESSVQENSELVEDVSS